MIPRYGIMGFEFLFEFAIELNKTKSFRMKP